MSCSFFKPFVGREYGKGIHGKKILVLGASFYCSHGPESKVPCPFFSECTSIETKDSSKFDLSCPFYAENGQKLSEEPSNAIAENYKAYQNFGRFMQQFAEKDVEDIWQRMAFTDYVQFFLPTTETKLTYLSQRDFDAFNEVLVDLKPDILVVWGEVINKVVRDKNPYVVDKANLPNTEWYISHIRMPQIPKSITLLCCYHPSAPIWNKDLGNLTKYMEQALKE